MKRIFAIAFACIVAISAYGQDITGQWNGILKVPGVQLRLVFNISQTENGLTATMDSPDQGAKDISVSATSFENSILKLEIKMLGAEYNGEFIDGKIAGTFSQSGQSFPLDLTREVEEKEVIIRPQEPIEPFPYYSEEITFHNTEANIDLAGTLTLPKKEGKFPVVILITGSGPQNRNEELMGHKPFLIISDYLTRNGIAVLRYDDRGSFKSTGDFKMATSVDLASDVESAIAYLKTRKEIDKKKIGLVGHSEGGIIAPMVAAKSKDVNFIVLLAGTGIRGDKLLVLQQNLIAKASGVSEQEIQKSNEVQKVIFEKMMNSTDLETLKSDLTKYLQKAFEEDLDFEVPEGMTAEQLIETELNQLLSPWFQFFVKYDPAPALEKVKCPVLALNGQKDLQVPPTENLTAIENALKKGGNKHFTIKEFPNLNHLFQECETGAPFEYAKIEQTFSPIVLEEMSKWINEQVK